METFLQNEVILGATKVTPNQNIKWINPVRRNCLFEHENPPNQPLAAYKKYSQVGGMHYSFHFGGTRQDTFILQVSCIFECRIKKALSNMTEGNKCIPWYYPPVNNDTRMCSPFEADEFKKGIELISVNECRVRQNYFIFILLSCYDDK